MAGGLAPPADVRPRPGPPGRPSPAPRGGGGEGRGGGGAAGGLNPSNPGPAGLPRRGTCWPRARRWERGPTATSLPTPGRGSRSRAASPGPGRPARSSQPGGSALCFPNFGHLLEAERPRRPGDRRFGESLRSGRPGPSASPRAPASSHLHPRSGSVSRVTPTGAPMLGSPGLHGVTSADSVQPHSSVPCLVFLPLYRNPPHICLFLQPRR